MDILFFTHFLNGFLMVLMPVALGIYLTRRFNMHWRLWWIGAATFVLSQVGHIPFNYLLTLLFKQGVLPSPPEAYQLLFSAVVLGLSAGLWEELARYATYRWWAKDARSWRAGLLLGAGHGGVEAITLGLLVLFAFVNMVIARQASVSSLVPPEQLALAEEQATAYWSSPWYLSLFGALERAFTIPFHLAASLLVLQVFVRQQRRWLWLAVGWHAFIDASAVYAVGSWDIYITEAIIGVFALVNIAIIFALRQPEPEPEPVEPQPAPLVQMEISLPEIEETSEKLEDTRYN